MQNNQTIETVQLGNQTGCIRVLTPEDVDQAIQLQDIIMQNLKENEKTFIIKKSREDFLKAINGRDGVMIGVFVENQLIAQQILYLHGTVHHEPLYAKKLPLSGANAEIGGALVHPNYRVYHLTKKMMSILEKTTKSRNIDYLTAEVHLENPWSYRIFLEQSFFIAHSLVDPDPNDQSPLVLLFKPLNQQMTFKRLGAIKMSHQEIRVPNAKSFIAGGYYGTKAKCNKSTKEFTLFFTKILHSEAVKECPIHEIKLW